MWVPGPAGSTGARAKPPCLPLGAILYWLADFLAGSERRALQADPRAAQLASYWLTRDTAVFFHPSVPLNAALEAVSVPASANRAPARHPRPVSAPAARSKSWQSIMAAMASM